LHAKLIYLPEELGDDSLTGVAIPMFKNLLQGVVPIWVLRELVCIWDDLFEELVSMVLGFSLLDENLDHSQTHIVHC
jgi:hypothetical protein